MYLLTLLLGVSAPLVNEPAPPGTGTVLPACKLDPPPSDGAAPSGDGPALSGDGPVPLVDELAPLGDQPALAKA